MASSLSALGTPPWSAVAATSKASVWPRKVSTLSPFSSSSSCVFSRNWQNSAAISHRSAAAAGHGSEVAPKEALGTSMKSRIRRNWRKSAVISHRSVAAAGHGSKEAPKEALRTSVNSRIRAKLADIEAEEGLETDDDFIKRKRPLRPVVERFNIYHEKNVSEERLKELGVGRWSKWECGPGVTCSWQWKVDELVYISKGSVEVVPDGCYDGAFFYAGDLVRFPKWFEASLTFDEDYEQHYKFLAYGD